MKTARYTMGLWIVSQCVLGVVRSGLAAVGKDYPSYINLHGEYRRHDWNVAAFSKILRHESNVLVWVAVADPWVVEYLNLTLGWEAHLLSINGIRDRKGEVLQDQVSSNLPVYLLTEKKIWQMNNNVAFDLAAQNEELLLLKARNDSWKKPLLVSLLNSRKVEKNLQGESCFWMDGDTTRLKLVSSSEGRVFLKARFVMGPSLPEQTTRRIRVQSQPYGFDEYVTISGAVHEIEAPVKQGINEVSLTVVDQPSVQVLANSDRSPLLLRVDNLHID